jgi:hypothetical protein
MAGTRQFLYMLKPVRGGMLTDGPTSEEALVLEQHAAYLSGLAEEGTACFGE